MSDTPRTDKLLHLLAGIKAVNDVPSLVDHARQLERENAALRQALKAISDFDPDGTRPCEMARAALAATEAA